jgi:hypothetical protein
MHVHHFVTSLLTIVLLYSCNAPVVQKSNNAPAPAEHGTWKKLVTRDVDLNEREDTVTHHLKDQDGDTALFQMLVNAVKSGKITAYNNIGGFFANKLSAGELNSILEPKVDTVVITDPVTGSNTTSVVPRDFKYRDIHIYQILEEWVFDPASGKTGIQITGIAPMMDVYSENLRGVEHAIFWLRFEEARGILAAYEQLHPDNTLASHIWSDYFQSDIKPAVQK